MCVRAVKALARLCACVGASEHLMIKYLISVKSLISQSISLQSSHFLLKIVTVLLFQFMRFIQSNQAYCDLHTQHMIMKVCMHKVLLKCFRATYPKHCYMIIDSGYMTEKMLIVILSTNAPTKIMKFKAITERKKKQ